MGWRGYLRFLGAGVVLLIGLAFLAAGVAGAGAADEYRAAGLCANPPAPADNCYTLTPGTISSVAVRQTRRGEEDSVQITTGGGGLSVTLQPSITQAQQVRTGAGVQVQTYRGKVTAVFVERTGVPSIDNPARANSDFYLYGGILVLSGLGYLAFELYRVRRRSNQDGLTTTEAALATGAMAAAGASLPQEVDPAGNLGVVARPKLGFGLLWRMGFVVLALISFTVRGLFDPDRALLIGVFDLCMLGIVAIFIAMFVRNSMFFVDPHGVGQVNPLGRVRVYPRTAVARAVRFSVSNRYGSTPSLYLVDDSNRKLLGVGGTSWNMSELDAICQQAGIPLTGSYDDVISAFEMNSRVKGAANWRRTTVIAVAMIVVVTIVVVVLAGPSTR